MDPSEPEAAEARGEVRLRALLEGMLDPVVSIDSYGIIREVSRSVESVFGYTPRELVGRNISVLMPEPFRSEHDGYLEKYRRTGETWILGKTREFEIVRKDQRRIVCELSVSRVDVPGGDEPLFIGSFRDVTRRKEAEHALVESERRLRAIFDQEFQFVGLLTTEGSVLEVNRAALDAVGIQREDVIGKPFWETSWWSHDVEAQERLRKATTRAAAGEFVRYETEFLGKGRQAISVDFSLKPVRDGDGRVTMLLPEGRDITHLKEAQRRETAMLRALATLGESASVLAHEIKNPITGINIALKAVAEQLGQDHRAMLEDLAGRMEKLEQTMRRTLAFARPLKIEVEPCRPEAVVREVLETWRPLIEQAKVVSRVECAPGLPPVLVDPGLIEEVLGNLIRNSVEALEEGGHLALRCMPGPGHYVRFAVEDDGPGIPGSLLENLFKPFVSTKSGGTGLGLAICKKIVEEHGGAIEAGEGELGGAGFFILLPGKQRS